MGAVGASQGVGPQPTAPLGWKAAKESPHSKAGEAPAEEKKSGVKPPHSKAGEAPAAEKKSGVKPPHSKASGGFAAGRGPRSVHLFEIVMLLAGIVFISPCFLALLNSFKSLAEITQSPLALPRDPQWGNYRDVFVSVKLAGPMVNSFLMCVAVIACLVTIASMAAYSLMRNQTLMGRFLRLFFLAGLTVPFQIIMVPLLKEFKFLGIHSSDEMYLFGLIHVSYLALLIHHVSWGLPLCIFIYSGFMATIPKELEEAAAIDGCGPIATFWRIVFPLLTPCTVSIVVFWGLWIWNDFMQAFIIMGTNKGQLVFVQLWRFLSDQYVQNWNTIFAGVVVLSAPVTLLYVAMQRHFIKGITAGAIK